MGHFLRFKDTENSDHLSLFRFGSGKSSKLQVKRHR